MTTVQVPLFGVGTDDLGIQRRHVPPFKDQLLKWVGNKQRFAHQIASQFPARFGTYFEPFLGSGAVLGTLMPPRAIGSDALEPLIGIWQAVATDPQQVKEWYSERWLRYTGADRIEAYEEIKASYNQKPNAPDLLFLSRSCYGGVVRFRQGDGFISTPCGTHRPVDPGSFARRVDIWHYRTRGATFEHSDFESMMSRAAAGDLVYCDPPYTHTQSILYGAQAFALRRLFSAIADCKERGVYVALSIDGTKRSGAMVCDIGVPDGLFETEAMVNCGRSMLRRFQMSGESLEAEVVADRLLLTF